jgi:hypothetical protein
MVRQIGETTVAFEYTQHVGPRFIHGGVTLKFEPADRFIFHSIAQWPTSDNYDASVEQGVKMALASRGGLCYRCTLEAIKWHDLDSSAIGFERAAKAATIGLLESCSD